MKWIILYGLMLNLLTGCTYNISMVHTEGQAEDVIDTTQKADAKVDPTVTIPVSPL